MNLTEILFLFGFLLSVAGTGWKIYNIMSNFKDSVRLYIGVYALQLFGFLLCLLGMMVDFTTPQYAIFFSIIAINQALATFLFLLETLKSIIKVWEDSTKRMVNSDRR